MTNDAELHQRIVKLWEKFRDTNARFSVVLNPYSFDLIDIAIEETRKYDKQTKENKGVSRKEDSSNATLPLSLKSEQEIREAMAEEIMKKVDDLYHKIGKSKVWRLNNDQVCDNCEMYVKEIVRKTLEEK